MKAVLLVGFLAIGTAAFGQIAMEAHESQLLPRALVVTLTGVPQPILVQFGDNEGRRAVNYHVYLIEHVDESNVHVTDTTATFIAPNAAISFDGALLLVPLLSDFQSNRAYLIALDNIPGANIAVNTRIATKPTLSSPDVSKTATEIKINSGIRLSAGAAGIQVLRRRIVSGPAGPVEVAQTYAAGISRTESDGLFIALKGKLPAGKQSNLTVTGLEDAFGNQVNIKGTVTVTGVQANEKDSWLLIKLNSSAAVHSSPVFQFTMVAAPLNPPSQTRYLCHNWFTLCNLTTPEKRSIRFNPSINFDIGFNSTKSANSVIVPASFQKVWLFEKKHFGFTNLNFSFGPRFETDRRFARYNTLGEFRSDFIHDWLYRSVIAKKKRLGGDTDLIEGINWGYEIVPYVQFDGGGHTNEEVVTNSSTQNSVTVPTHTVVRTYVGLQNTFEYRRATLSIDSSVIHFAADEIVGFTTKKDALLRRLEGIQPHTKLTFDYALDIAKHFSANVTFENGRSAPNFEYLNKLDSGIKIIF